ncbi:hypothetical protein [Mesorhizobium sp. CN2-181]|uniref:universal stress protein n=1 Tax=Mesorhizobium yinganensis TaxID=3157707 RepID=UPI0032B7A109
MRFKSILVNLDVDGPVAPLFSFAMKLARRFEAVLIGFSAADAPLPFVGPEGSVIAGEVWQQERDDIERRLKELRAEVDKLASGSLPVEWQQMVGDPTHTLTVAARLADLIVTGAPQGASVSDGYRAADLGSVILQAGRPVLVAADGAEQLSANRVVVAWKDTREARRAVADAVPLLLSPAKSPS